MIGKYIGRFLMQGEDPLMIDAEQCATVRTENTLMHAMLLLTSVGYTSIPVLDDRSQLAGTITMPGIVNGVLEDDNYNWELLNCRKVRDVMQINPPTVFDDAKLEDVLRLLIQSNYICVTDRKNRFKGIVARKQILKRLNRLAHEFEIAYDVTPAHATDLATYDYSSITMKDLRAI
ncbi:MAG: CBS domain-containing protein [Clostridiaceae bacterium]|jgi:predicted transcriptional regulator|nr:CBS domain-containing protein [Clostridiaceae bacterium]